MSRSNRRDKSRTEVAKKAVAQPLGEQSVVSGIPVSSVSALSATSYSGPIPSPSLLEHYDRVVPGLAGRIIELYETQTHHRISLEEKVTTSDIYRSWTGLVFGFIVAMTITGCGTFLAFTNHDWVGGALTLGGLASLVGVFVYGSQNQRKERTDKAKIMAGSRK